ncbi:hypothetical protein [Neisseria sicca]|uniref:hypothetical protein n=1 Tax=Neisseria sicca TaxID=490 RepID=UPI0011BCF6DB|nr:hypothetical protein [Neisseria sicca]
MVEKEEVGEKSENGEIGKKYDRLSVAKLGEKWGVTREEWNGKVCDAGLEEIEGLGGSLFLKLLLMWKMWGGGMI